MTPDTFLARLCALVPPPGAHTVRYYGVLAGHHALRSRITPRPLEAIVGASGIRVGRELRV